jgi:cell wall-associated NlpC family hydrolase
MSEIVRVARSWVGTKFHHQGRKKNIGVDCIGLIVGVAQELGLPTSDRLNYARQPDESELQNALDSNLQKCGLQVGAIALFSIDNRAQHVGIISNYNEHFGVIHAYIQARKVVEHTLDRQWQKRIISCYSF